MSIHHATRPSVAPYTEIEFRVEKEKKMCIAAQHTTQNGTVRIIIIREQFLR